MAGGAIFAGFSGIFLQFKLQREATYHRQPAVLFKPVEKEDTRHEDYKDALEPIGQDLYIKLGTDVLIGRSHFSVSFLLLILSVLIGFIFGLILPLCALSNATIVAPRYVVGGLTVAVVFLLGYFATELLHYKVFVLKQPSDKLEFWMEFRICFVAILLIAAIAAYLSMSRVPPFES